MFIITLASIWNATSSRWEALCSTHVSSSDLVLLLKMPKIFEHSLFPAWWLDSLISVVESPVDGTASQDLGESTATCDDSANAILDFAEVQKP